MQGSMSSFLSSSSSPAFAANFSSSKSSLFLSCRKGKKAAERVSVRASNQDSVNSFSSLQSGSSSKNRLKVFENLSEGIVCYKDENGEIICEGYDEGPRLDCQHQFSRFYCNSRDAEIIEILEKNWQKMERREQLMGRKM